MCITYFHTSNNSPLIVLEFSKWLMLNCFAKLYQSRLWRCVSALELVGRVSNPKLFIITLYYILEKTIPVNFFHFLSHSMGNGAMQKKPHNKKLIPKYLGKLLDKTFSKYSNLNPKHKYVRTCSIISITSCNYIAVLRIWSDLTILHQPVFLQVYNTSEWNWLKYFGAKL